MTHTAADLAEILAQPGYGIVTDATAVHEANRATVIVSGIVEDDTVASQPNQDSPGRELTRIPYPNELTMQQAFLDALSIHATEYPDVVHIYAIPNQVCYGRRPAPGQRAGMPDHHLPVAVLPSLSLYLEAKMPGEKPSKAQLAEHARLRKLGHAVHVWDDVDTAVAVVLQYLRGEYPPF